MVGEGPAVDETARTTEAVDHFQEAPPEALCEDLPLVATRALAAHELAQLALGRPRLRRRAWAAAAAAVMGPTSVFLSIMESRRLDDYVVQLFGFAPYSSKKALLYTVCFILFGLVIPAVGAFVLNATLMALFDQTNDLRHGRVLRFRGPLRERGRKLRQRVGAPDRGNELELDVLEGSGRLRCVDGQPPRRAERLTVARVAVQPARARIASQWLKPFAMVDGNSVAAGTRPLSADESTELRRNVKFNALVSLLFGAFGSAGIAAALALLFGSGSLRIRALLAFFPGAWGMALMYGAAAHLLPALRMWRDASEGFVYIFRIEPKEGTPFVFERLPRTQSIWTVDGHPGPERAASTVRLS